MNLEQKLKVIEGLCFSDPNGVVWRLPTPARRDAERLLRENPGMAVHDVLPRIPVEPPLVIPAF